jgi:hypothetical protein
VSDGNALPGELVIIEDGEVIFHDTAIECKFVGGRFKAVGFKPTFRVTHKKEELYAEIMKLDSDDRIVGPELLFHNSEIGYFTLHLKNQTLQKDGKKCLKYVGKDVNLSIRTIKGKKHTWYGLKMEETVQSVLVLDDAIIDEFGSADDYIAE